MPVEKILRSPDYFVLGSRLAIGLLVPQADSLLILGLSTLNAFVAALPISLYIDKEATP